MVEVPVLPEPTCKNRRLFKLNYLLVDPGANIQSRHDPIIIIFCDPVFVDKLYAGPGHDGVGNSLHIGKLVR